MLLLALLLLPLAALATAVGDFTLVKGQVTVTWAVMARAAVPGLAVEVGDIVTAGENAKAETRFIDGTIMRVARDSRVEIKKYLVAGQQVDVKLKLATGTIQNIVPHLAGRLFGKEAPSRFEVDTPVATCGVRGTDFITSYRNGMSQATFLTGRGYAFNIKLPRQVVSVSAGETMEITRSDAPPAVRKATPQELGGEETAVSEQERQAQADEGVKEKEALGFTPAETPEPPKIKVDTALPPRPGTISQSVP